MAFNMKYDIPDRIGKVGLRWDPGLMSFNVLYKLERALDRCRIYPSSSRGHCMYCTFDEYFDLLE